jgi:glycosyltransferase involved in cell wall biosynthesis
MLDDEIARAPLVIVHSLYRAHLPSIARLCRLRHVPYWVVAHGMLDPWVLARRRAAKRLWLRLHGQSCLREAATVLFSTASEREKARIAYGGSNVAVIPWPIDIPGTDGRPAARAAVRNGLGIGPERNVLLWLGRYDSLKRPVTIVEAFARGAPRDWVLIMAGFPGDTPRNRVETAADRFAPGRVHVLGPATGADKSRLLLGADAFVSLSWRENYGYAVAEAMAAGLPIVIAPDHDLLADGAFLHFGSRCADHSVASAIAAVAGLCGQKAALRMAGGDRAREWATRSLTRDLFQNNVERLLGATSTALGRQVELTPVNHHPT